MNELIKIENINGEFRTTSKNVSDVFGKRHNDVVAKIEKIQMSNNFRLRNFSHTRIDDKNGSSVSGYSMTRDGWSLIVMSFTGKKATAWKEKYIDAFNKMQHQIEERQQIDYEAIGKMIGMAVTAALVPVIDRLDKMPHAKALPEPIKEDHYSLVAYCAIKGMKINRSELALHGKELKKIANRQGIKLKKIPDERWGFVNSYPIEILDEYFAA